MSLKEYNVIQIKIFKKYNLTKNDNFTKACKIIETYRNLNNTYYFLKQVIKALKVNNII